MDEMSNRFAHDHEFRAKMFVAFRCSLKIFLMYHCWISTATNSSFVASILRKKLLE